MKIGFIGAGKVGCTLGLYFRQSGLAEIAGYSSRSLSSAQEAAGLTDSRAFSSRDELIKKCDSIFITAPDSDIRSIYESIRGDAVSGKIICHCSGAMTAEEAFPDIAAYGASGCSIHPLFPVSDRYTSYKRLGEAMFCLEGDSAGVAVWEDLLRRMGLRTRQIPGEAKSRYHAACAVMSNLVCALAAESTELLAECGFTDEEARMALRPLAESNLSGILSRGAAEALTGPVERCDIPTVKKHLECIPEGTDRELYRFASLKLVELARQKHPERDYSGMEKLLNS